MVTTSAHRTLPAHSRASSRPSTAASGLSSQTKLFTPLTKAEYEHSKAWGMAMAIDIHGCDPALVRDADAIKLFVKELCVKIDMKRFGDTLVVNFGEDEKVAGFSMTQLIETSLISAHFANQTNSVYLDVFSCKFYEAQTVIDYALSFFRGTSYNAHCLLRGCAEFPKAYQQEFSGRNIVLNTAFAPVTV
ncbi:MAG: S-adenosylmethionine decarboxylase [Candidatus Peribacteraceae bacterium]|jgi:S-adenosylmethionine/arginine decarboxylase-like enzyme